MPDVWSGPTHDFAFPIEAGHVLAFARAIGDDDPVGYAPPTFAAASDHFDPLFDRRPPRGSGWQTGLPASHLHVEQHFTYARPIEIGERLTARRGRGRRWSKTGRSGALDFVEERTELYDTTGALVQVMLWVDVHAEQPHVALTNAQRGAPAPVAAAPAVPAVPAPVPPPAGAGLVALAEDLSRTQFVMYAGASGDFHPLHHDEAMARAEGYPSVFAPGMLTMALTGRAVTAMVDRTALRSFGGRFRAQVWPGDTLTGTVVRIEDGRVEVVTRRQDGTIVFEGHATHD